MLSTQINMSSENKDLIKSVQAALEQNLRGEEVDLSVYFHPDASWHIPQSSPSVSDRYGRDDVLELFSGDVGDYYKTETMQFDYHYFTADEDRVSMLFTLTAITAKGDEYKNLYHTLFRIKDGQIFETWEIMDTAYLFAMMTPD